MFRIYSTNPFSSHHKFRDDSMMSADCQLHWISWVQKITVTTISRSKLPLEWRDFYDSSDSFSFWWNDDIDDTNFSRNSGCCSSHWGTMPMLSPCTTLLSSICYIHLIMVLIRASLFPCQQGRSWSLILSLIIYLGIPWGLLLSYDITCHFCK